jgi:hypothetical protein
MLWLYFQHPVKTLEALLEAMKSRKGVTPIQMSFDQARLQGYRPVEAGERLLQTSKILEYVPPITLRHGVRRIDRHGLIQARKRLRQSLHVAKDVSPVRVARGRPGSQGDRGVCEGKGFGVTAQATQGEPKIRASVWLGPVNAQRRADQIDRPLMVSGLMRRQAQQMEGVEVRRLPCEDLLVQMSRVDHLALLMEGKGAVEKLRRERLGKSVMVFALHGAAPSRSAQRRRFVTSERLA